MRRARIGVAGLAVVPLLLALAGPTYAGTRDATGPLASQNCVNHLERIVPNRPEARITSTICFRSFAEAFRHMTRGRIAVPSDLRPDQVTQAMIDAGPSSVIVLGTDYSGSNYSSGGFGGFSINWEGSSTCTPSLSWTVTYVGDSYNDKISSAKSYGGCHRFNHFEDGGFGGSVRVCQPNCPTMGVMDNQTSSLSWDY